VKTGSFVRAGETLRHSNSAISKAVARLEKRLGVRLLERSTRRLALSAEGRSYFADCRQLLGELERANERVRARSSAPQGALKLHFPLLWAREVVVPALPEFRRRYPDIALAMDFSESAVDFRDGYDLSVQVGSRRDKTVVEQVLCPTRSLLVAAPDYLRVAGTPAHPEDLARHACIRFMSPDQQLPVPWSFSHAGRVERRVVAGSLDISDPAALVAAALAGLGIIQAPDIALREHLSARRLQQVLKRWETHGPSITMRYPRSRFMPARLQVFVDWLAKLAREHRPSPHS